jgi:hypothetical protein
MGILNGVLNVVLNEILNGVLNANASESGAQKMAKSRKLMSYIKKKIIMFWLL